MKTIVFPKEIEQQMAEETRLTRKENVLLIIMLVIGFALFGIVVWAMIQFIRSW